MVFAVAVLQAFIELSDVLFNRRLSGFANNLIDGTACSMHHIVLPLASVLIVYSYLSPSTFCHVLHKLSLIVAHFIRRFCHSKFTSFRKRIIFTCFGRTRAVNLICIFAIIVVRFCLKLKSSVAMLFIIKKRPDISHSFRQVSKFSLSMSNSMSPLPLIIPFLIFVVIFSIPMRTVFHNIAFVVISCFFVNENPQTVYPFVVPVPDIVDPMVIEHHYSEIGPQLALSHVAALIVLINFEGSGFLVLFELLDHVGVYRSIDFINIWVQFHKYCFLQYQIKAFHFSWLFYSPFYC